MKVTTLTLPDDLYDRLKSEAAKRGRSMAEILRGGLEQQLREGFGPAPSLRDVPRHRSGPARGSLHREEIFDEMIGARLRR